MHDVVFVIVAVAILLVCYFGTKRLKSNMELSRRDGRLNHVDMWRGWIAMCWSVATGAAIFLVFLVFAY
jgi:hypothetical protein